jgi:predicted nucleic acid-binding Zn ribbon protein
MEPNHKYCSWCGRGNPAEAETCRACGTPLTGHQEFSESSREREKAQPRWKRRAMLVGAIVVVAAVIAVVVWVMATGDESAALSPTDSSQAVAGGASTSTTDVLTTTTALELPDPAPTTAFGEEMRFWGTSMTVTSPHLLQDEAVQELLGPDIDVYVVSVTIKNDGDESRDYNLFYWSGADNEGNSYDASLYLEDQALDSGDIPPGETVTGNVGFELPKGKALASVAYSPMLADSTATWEQSK